MPRAEMKDVLNTAEAAEYLGVCVAYLESARVKGGGPRYAKISPRIVRYRRTTLDEWVASHEVGSTSEAPK